MKRSNKKVRVERTPLHEKFCVELRSMPPVLKWLYAIVLLFIIGCSIYIIIHEP